MPVHKPRLAALAPPARIALLIEQIARANSFAPERIIGASRHRRVVIVRDEICYRLRRLNFGPKAKAPTYVKIGQWLGGRDHSTILFAERRHALRLAEYRAQFRQVA